MAKKIRFRESFIKHENKLYIQESRILLDEWDSNGRKQAEESVTDEMVDSVIKLGVLQPLVVSPDPQKRVDPVTGLPMVQLHSGARRTYAVRKAAAQGFKGFSSTTPVLMCSMAVQTTDECLPCLPIILDKAENYEDRTTDLERQLALNTSVEWSAADKIEAALEYVDAEGGKAEEFGRAAAMTRPAVQRLLRIGRVDGLVKALRSGRLKNVAVADAVATMIKQNPELTVEQALQTVAGMEDKQTAANVKDALNTKDAAGKGTTTGTDAAAEKEYEEGGLKDAGSNTAGAKEKNPTTGLKDAGTKEAKYNFCTELSDLTKRGKKTLPKEAVVVLERLTVGMKNGDDALTMLADLKALLNQE